MTVNVYTQIPPHAAVPYCMLTYSGESDLWVDIDLDIAEDTPFGSVFICKTAAEQIGAAVGMMSADAVTKTKARADRLQVELEETKAELERVQAALDAVVQLKPKVKA